MRSLRRHFRVCGSLTDSGAQIILGVVVGLLLVAFLWLWNESARFGTVMIGCAGIAVLTLLFRFPYIGVGLAVFAATSNISTYVPGIFSLVLSVTLIVLIVQKALAHDPTWTVTPLVRWGLLFAVWWTVSAVWSTRYDYFTFEHLYRISLILLVFSEAVRTPRQFLAVVLAGGIGMAVSGILIIHGALEFFRSGAYGQISGMVKHADDIRFGGQWAEVNAMALALIPMIGLNIAVLRTKFPISLRLLSFVAVILGLICVVLSLSRGGIICSLVMLLIIISAERHRWRSLLIAVSILSVIIALSPVNLFHRVETIIKPRGDASIQQRTQVALGGIEMIENSFPLGVGLGNFRTDAEDYAWALYWGIIAHNTYIEIFAEAGVVGLVLLLGVLFSAYRLVRLRRRRSDSLDFNRNLAIGMGGSLAAIVIGMITLSASGYTPFWIVLALIGLRPAVFGGQTWPSHQDIVVSASPVPAESNCAQRL